MGVTACLVQNTRTAGDGIREHDKRAFVENIDHLAVMMCEDDEINADNITFSAKRADEISITEHKTLR